jgi:hypothetical protein
MRISQAVGAYVTHKQSLGIRFATEARTLRSFYLAVGDVDMNQVESDQVCAYLAGKGPVTRFWHRKLDALRGFYRFALARGYATRSPLQTVPAQPPTFVLISTRETTSSGYLLRPPVVSAATFLR